MTGQLIGFRETSLGLWGIFPAEDKINIDQVFGLKTGIGISIDR